MEKACRTCLKLLRLQSVPYFEVEDADVQLSPNSNRYKILSVFPEMALNISKKSVICSSCHEILEMIYHFKMKCLRTESMIMRYIHSKPDLEIETIDLKDVALVNNTGYVTNTELNSSHGMNLEKRNSSHLKSKESSVSSDNSLSRNRTQIENVASKKIVVSNEQIDGFIGDGVVIEKVNKNSGNKIVEVSKAGVTIEKVHKGEITIEKRNINATNSTECTNLNQELTSREFLQNGQIFVKEEMFTEEEEESFLNSNFEIDESITVVKHELINEDEHEMVIPPENIILNVTPKINEEQSNKRLDIEKNVSTIKPVKLLDNEVLNKSNQNLNEENISTIKPVKLHENKVTNQNKLERADKIDKNDFISKKDVHDNNKNEYKLKNKLPNLGFLNKNELQENKEKLHDKLINKNGTEVCNFQKNSIESQEKTKFFNKTSEENIQKNSIESKETTKFFNKNSEEKIQKNSVESQEKTKFFNKTSEENTSKLRSEKSKNLINPPRIILKYDLRKRKTKNTVENPPKKRIAIENMSIFKPENKETAELDSDDNDDFFNDETFSSEEVEENEAEDINSKINNSDYSLIKNTSKLVLKQKGDDGYLMKNPDSKKNPDMYEILNKSKDSEISLVLVKKKRKEETNTTSDLSIIPVGKKVCTPREENNKQEMVKVQSNEPQATSHIEIAAEKTKTSDIEECEAILSRTSKANKKVEISIVDTEAILKPKVGKQLATNNKDNSICEVKVESEEIINELNKPGVDKMIMNSHLHQMVNTAAINNEQIMNVEEVESSHIKTKFEKGESLTVKSSEINEELNKVDAKNISLEKAVVNEKGSVELTENLVDVKINEELTALDLQKVKADEFEVTSMELAAVHNSDDELKVDDESSKLDDSGVQSGGSEDSLKNEDPSLQCTVCLKLFVTKSRLRTHMFCHTDERPYKCTFCVKGFNDKSTLKKHIKIHSGIKEFECEICQRQFFCKGNLNKHRSTHNNERPYKCTICNRDFSRNEHLKQHSLIHSGDKNFECDICNKRFARRDSLIIHMMVHTGVRNYICEYCDKRCIDSSTLKKHLRSHTGDKPYECDVCQRRFTQKTHLTIHRRKHTGERPYNCNLCSKSFYSSNYLKIHKRTHTKEQPYECDVCKKKFSTVSNLRMHSKIHTGIRDFECAICNKMFIHKHDLRKHMMVHTQERPFSCHVCGKGFNKKTRAKQHIMKLHKDVDISLVVIEHNNTYVKEKLKVEEGEENVGGKD